MRKLRHSEIPRISQDELANVERHPITVVVENVRSAYNVGSILRTCDAALVEKVITAGYTPAPDHRKVRKTALGAESSVEWKTTADVAATIRELKQAGYTVAVLEITDTPTSIQEIGARHFPLALVVGNEITGVSDEIVAAADLAVEIPQYGAKQSLNVAVAFGIAAVGLVDRFRRTRPKPP